MVATAPGGAGGGGAGRCSTIPHIVWYYHVKSSRNKSSTTRPAPRLLRAPNMTHINLQFRGAVGVWWPDMIRMKVSVLRVRFCAFTDKSTSLE